MNNSSRLAGQRAQRAQRKNQRNNGLYFRTDRFIKINGCFRGFQPELFRQKKGMKKILKQVQDDRVGGSG